MALLRNDVCDLVVWTYHHILMDGPSRTVVFQDWCDALRAIASGRPPQLTPTRPPSFAEHLAVLEAAEPPEARALWREQLNRFSGGTPLPPWPADTRRARTTMPAVEETYIEDLEVVSNRARQHGATLNALIQGAWALALAHYNAVNDVTFGTIRAGRHLRGHDRATGVGMFITIVPFRVDATASQPVGSWLRRLARQQMTIRAGEFASPAQIRAWANLSPELPLFHTVLVFTPDDAGETARSSGELNDIAKSEGITLAAYAGRRLRLLIEYPPDEYSGIQIRLTLKYVRALILALADAASEETLATIYVHALKELGGPALRLSTPVDFPKGESVVDLFRMASLRRSAAPAITHNSRQICFRELDRQSDELAALLLRKGLKLEEPVALVLDRSIEFVLAALGVLKAGGSYLPIDPDAPARRTAQFVTQSGARWLLTRSDLRSQSSECTAKIIELNTSAYEGQLCAADSPAATILAPDPVRRAYLICTSGSTGAAKIVEIEHHSLTNLIYHHQHYLKLTSDDRASWLSSPAFDASVADIWPILCSGGTLCIPNRQCVSEPDRLITWITTEGITIAFAPTSLAERLLGRPWPDRLSLRFFGVGGDVLQTRPRSGLCFVVLNAYGPTENTVDSAWAIIEPSRDSNRPSIGRPIANVHAYIVDQELRLLPQGEVGELCLGGEQVARGYLNDPEATRERFIPDPFSEIGGRIYRTGDLVRLNEDGELEFFGRIDLQVKIGSFRVELQEIESALRRHSEVIEACCTPIKEGVITRGVAAHITTSAPTSLLADHLRSFLRDELPAYMIPAKFIFHTSLPHTHTGKIDRPVLSSQASVPGLSTRPPPPSSEAFADALHKLWNDLLQSAVAASSGDSFWELGGDSLKLIQLSLGVEEVTGKPLPMPTFLMDPTLRGLRNAVASDEPSEADQRGCAAGTTSSKDKRQPMVVQLQKGNGGLPVYFIYAGPEPALLAQMMGSERSIFGIEVPWPLSWRNAALKTDVTQLPTMEQLVAPFVAALNAHARSSPCALAGHSFAAVMAFEAAHQLQKLGGKVEMVMLLDAWLKRPPPYLVAWTNLQERWKQTLHQVGAQRNGRFVASCLWRGWLVLRWALAEGMGSWLVEKTRRKFSQIIQRRRAPLGELTMLFDEDGRPIERELVLRLYAKVERSYEPYALNSRGVLFRTRNENQFDPRYDSGLGWEGLFTHGLEVVTVPGDHFSMIRQESCRLALATQMNEALHRHLQFDEAAPD